MIKPHLYESLPQDERRLWHSHVFEVKSGMLVMPQPSPLVPQALWEKAETAAMEEVVKLYGKVYHLWQVDRGDKLPLGEPQLMTSLTAGDQLPGLEQIMDERDKRFPGCDWRHKKEVRKGLEEPEIHPGNAPGCVKRLGNLKADSHQMPTTLGRKAERVRVTLVNAHGCH